MKDNNVIKGALIFAVILVLIEGIGLYFCYSSFDAIVAEKNKATDEAKKAQELSKKSAEAILALMDCINGRQDNVSLATPEAIDAALKSIVNDHTGDMAKYAQALGKTENNYQRALANLLDELDQKNKAHVLTQNEFLALETSYKHLSTLYETVFEMYSGDTTKAVDELKEARKNFEGELAKLKKYSDDAIKSKQDAIDEVTEQKTKADAAVVDLRAKAEDNQKTIKKQAQTLHDLTRVTFDRPHGAIESVNQQSKTVTINLGHADGLATRMTFTVYPPTITGISFASADSEDDANLCEVCRRERTLNASKASIEVVKILGEHKAQARILDDILTNPIVAGDVIYTPIWRPGQVQRFALAAGMRIPGVGQRDGSSLQSDLETIKNLILLNRGEVDAYISEGNDGHKRGELVGEITNGTTFIVLGDLNDDDNQDQDMMETQAKMRKAAEQYAVKVIGLKELLTKMGWKNVTPVKGFGALATESDLRIVPRGGVPTAPGTVSPIYTPRNDEALVSNQDRKAPTSSGTVSGMYGQGKTPVSSPGTVGDLFRQRQPSSRSGE